MRASDVLVLGGGPAGASAALALARAGFEVILLARPACADPPRFETLPPEIRSPLAELDVWESFQRAGHLSSPGMTAVWGGPRPVETDFLFNPLGPGWHVDRARFDAMLRQAAAAAGVMVREDVRVAGITGGQSGGWLLNGLLGSEPTELRARYLIDATGRAAFAARRLGGRRVVVDRLVAVVGTVGSGGAKPDLDRRALVESVQDGWWYSAPSSASLTSIAFVSDADLVRRLEPRGWHDRLHRAPFTAERAGPCERVDELRVVAACSSRQERVTGPGWLAAGDAAFAFDPLSGQGVYRAMESGLLAAVAVDGHLGGNRNSVRDYDRFIDTAFASYLQERSAYYGLERRWPRSPFWLRRLGSSAGSNSSWHLPDSMVHPPRR